jgi:hypothetical protein
MEGCTASKRRRSASESDESEGGEGETGQGAAGGGEGQSRCAAERLVCFYVLVSPFDPAFFCLQRRLRSIVEAYQEERAVLSLVSQIQSQPTQADLAEKERAEKEARRRLKEQQAEELRKVKEKREAKLAETARERERKSALERASAAPATQRDPSRLTQPTGAMIARAKQREEEEEAIEKYKREHGGRTPSTMLGRTSLGHTAMPSWRKGL